MKYVFLIFLLTPQFSFSMLRGIYKLQPARISLARTFATLTEAQKILCMKRLEELEKKLDEAEKDSIIEPLTVTRSEHMWASRMLANSAAKQRILDIEKQIFEIKMKLQEK